MKHRTPLLCLLLSSAGVCFFLIVRIGGIVPKFFEMVYKLRAVEALNSMPTPTRLASEHPWAFALALGAILSTAVIALNRYPLRVLAITVSALCAQALVFWVAMFCYCYEGFCGPGGLHQPASFDLLEFVHFAGGVFPLSLGGILVPQFCGFWNRGKPEVARDNVLKPH